jgi:hypothetical protein
MVLAGNYKAGWDGREGGMGAINENHAVKLGAGNERYMGGRMGAGDVLRKGEGG